MDFEETLEDSRQYKGALGAVAYVVLRGLRAGGVPDSQAEGVLEAMRAGLKGLSDPQCDTLVHVLERRLDEVRQGGMLYELVKLTGRMGATQARVLNDALLQAGVHARFNHAHLSDAFAGSDPDAEIWVPRGQLKEAMALMQGAEHAGARTVICAACREVSPAHFGACWACDEALAEVFVPPAK
ncbi:MAG: hypothetical protein ACI9U2_000322 [Bradymonadia bacterium]|jgi:hypothetical protein